jgi:hypothetical protein
MFLLKRTISWQSSRSSHSSACWWLPDPEDEGRMFLHNTGESQKRVLTAVEDHIYKIFLITVIPNTFVHLPVPQL